MALSFNKVNKVITILAPDTEITIQNLLNSIREYEDELLSMDIPIIASCAGKEPLGGGVVVGLTLTLLNDWQLAFEARGGPTYTQCTVAGGNIVATNINGSIFPTAFTQVLITASSSATQSDLAAIQYASFGGGVSIDITTSNVGTSYPIGNQEYPVNNLTDAVVIASNNGFNTLFIRESMIIDNGTDIIKFKLIGRSHVDTIITMDASATCSGITIDNANVLGVLDGETHLVNCTVGSVTYVNGHIHHCGLYGTIILDGNKDAVIENCFTVDQDSSPVIDMGGSGQDLAMPNYSGIVYIRNFNDSTGEVGVGLNAGMVVLDSTITDGLIIISGNGIISDNSTGNAIVNVDGLINRELITKASWNTVYYDNITGVSGTVFPIGTLPHPSNNLTDLLTIASSNNIKNILLHSNLILDQDVSGYSIDGIKNYTINLNNQQCLDTHFTQMTVTGSQASKAKFDTCKLYNLQGLNGSFKECVMPSIIPMEIATNAIIFMNNCRSAVPGILNPVLDFSNGGIGFNNRAYSGGIKIVNSTDPLNTSTIEFIAGKFNFDTSNTAGEFHVRGVIDTSGIDINSTANIHYTGSITTNREKEYSNVVYLDIDNGVSGDAYPIGLTSMGNASNNISDALSLATQHNCTRIMLNGNLTITSEHDISGITIEAARSLGNSITVESGATTSGTYFENLSVSGVMDGSVRYTTCVLGAITNFDGGAKNCLMVGDIIFSGTNNNYLTSCDTYVTSSAYISLHINEAALNIIRGRGRFGIFDKTSTNVTGIDLVGGFIYVDASCNAGEVHVSGIGSVGDDSDIGCIVRQGAINDEYIAKATWDSLLIDHNLDDTFGSTVYHDQFFNGRVYIDVTTGNSGIVYPTGTSFEPVNNLSDAILIADSINSRHLHIIGILPIQSGDDISDFTLISDRSLGNSVTVESGATTSGTYFENLSVGGAMNGSVRYTTCVLGAITNFDGGAKNCLLTDDIIFSGNGANYFTECDTYITDSSIFKKLIINDKLVNIIRCRGNYEIAGKTSNGTTAIDLVAGIIKVDSDCTAGEIFIAGIAEVIDNSNSGCEVNIRSLSHEAISQNVWDELLNGNTHNIPGTAGRRLRTLTSTVIRNENAQGAGTGNNQIQLDIDASDVDSAYDPAIVTIIGGSGIGQTRLILQYDGATRTATVDRSWKINPDDTSEFIIVSDAGREHVNEGLARGGTVNTITLNTLASPNNNAYKGQVVFIRSGTGEDQARRVISYDGTTKIATVGSSWPDIPNTTSGYVILPTGTISHKMIAEGVWTANPEDYTDDDTFGKEYTTTLSGISDTVNVIYSKLPAGTIASSGEYDESLTEIKTNLERILGLSQENYMLYDMNYITYNNMKLMTSGKIRLYSDAGSVGGDTNVIATYNIASNWSDDQLTTYKVTKI